LAVIVIRIEDDAVLLGLFLFERKGRRIETLKVLIEEQGDNARPAVAVFSNGYRDDGNAIILARLLRLLLDILLKLLSVFVFAETMGIRGGFVIADAKALDNSRSDTSEERYRHPARSSRIP
jgi:hypothetical protein